MDDEPTTSMGADDGGMNDMLLNQDPAVQQIFQQLLMALNNEPLPENLNETEQSDDLDMSLNGDSRRRRKQMVCKGCNLLRSHCAHGYCGSCYIREKIKNGEWTKENQRQCVNCHVIKRHYAKGLCRNCYQRVVSRPHQKLRGTDTPKLEEESCTECNEDKPIHCKGMCVNCYQRVLNRNKKKAIDDFKPVAAQSCFKCNEEKAQPYMRGMCESCYKVELMESDDYKNGLLRTCNVCKQLKKHHCSGMCQVCYKRGRMQAKGGFEDSSVRMCAACGQLKKIEAKGLCTSCFGRVFMRLQNASSNHTEPKRQNMRVCSACKQMKKHCCRGLCQQCYYLVITKKKLQSKGIIRKDDNPSFNDTSSQDQQSPCSSKEVIAGEELFSWLKNNEGKNKSQELSDDDDDVIEVTPTDSPVNSQDEEDIVTLDDD